MNNFCLAHALRDIVYPASRKISKNLSQPVEAHLKRISSPTRNSNCVFSPVSFTRASRTNFSTRHLDRIPPTCPTLSPTASYLRDASVKSSRRSTRTRAEQLTNRSSYVIQFPFHSHSHAHLLPLFFFPYSHVPEFPSLPTHQTVAMCHLHYKLAKKSPGVTEAPTADKVDDMLREFDTDNSGSLTEDEFLAFAGKWFDSNAAVFARRLIVTSFISMVVLPETADIMHREIPLARQIPRAAFKLLFGIGTCPTCFPRFALQRGACVRRFDVQDLLPSGFANILFSCFWYTRALMSAVVQCSNLSLRIYPLEDSLSSYHCMGATPPSHTCSCPHCLI